MRWPVRLIAVSTAVLLSSVVCLSIPITLRRGVQTDVPATNSDYVGSSACQRCHESEYGSWRRTLHVQMTKPIGEARVEGAFGGASTPVQFEANGRAYSMETRDSRYFISISKGGRPAEKFEVNYTLGARRFQGYLSKLPDGRIYVLPAFWHNEAKRWVDWKEITPIPDDPDHDLRQIWNITCVNCHATNLSKNFDVVTKTYATTWTEMGIGCEACHGPGRPHIALMDEWQKNPASKPKILKIFSPRTADPRQVFDACSYCHGNKNNSFFGFRPGDRYEDYALPFLISDPIPQNDPQGDFWPDGRPSRFNRPQALMITGCFQKGQVTCTRCHTMHNPNNSHSLKVEVEARGGGHTQQSDTLCTQCHAVGSGGSVGSGGVATGYGAEAVAPRAIADLSAHTHHAPDSPGSRCIECHMSDVNWRLITRRRDHTFQPPVPEMTSRFGVPSACTTCHEDKTPEWAASVMDRWYGNGDRRRAVVAMAETIYRAGAGDASVLPQIARLAADRSHGATIRASAAEFAGQLIAKSPGAPIDPVIVNALVGAAADPEPNVRVTAVRSLALTNDPRALPVLGAHLGDPVRLVRVGAAEGLFARGVTVLEGAAGQALRRAQDEWADSLRTFNDDSSDHATLGWLEAARGHSEQGVAELRTAVDLDSLAPRPHVYLGVLAARAGKFEEALQHFRTAKRLAPDYQNLDRLIEEAQKRLTIR